MLAAFAPATLERYLACTDSFIAFHQADGSCTAHVSPAVLADYLSASQSSLTQDRGLHGTSPITAIKALRWWSKQCMWSELWDAMQSSLVRAYSKNIAIKDVKESLPIPMAVVVAWERAVCDRKSLSQSVRLFLGAALLCTHGSIRFGDIRRTAWSSLQLSTLGLHGTSTATKTTRRGQPFAVTWHGITGRDAQSSWLLSWLAELAELLEPRSQCKLPEQPPDFLFLNCTLSSPRIYSIAPASYSRTLLKPQQTLHTRTTAPQISATSSQSSRRHCGTPSVSQIQSTALQ